MGKSHDLATFLDDGAPGDLIVDSGHQLRVTRSDGLTFGTISKGNANSALGSGIIYNDVNADGHHFKLGGVTKMNIDTAGRVTMPDQPWALVDLGGGANYVSHTGVMAFNNVVQSNGSHYNTSTHRFVCPVDGVYSIAFSVLSANATDQFHVNVLLNGTRFARSYVTYRANKGYVEYRCAANDYLQIFADNISVYPGTGIDMYTWACYRLLG